MRKIFIAAILFVAQYSYAQQFVNPPVFGTYGNDGINFQAAAFRNNATPKFHFGWNWGSQGGIIDDALGINAYHTNRWLNYASQNRPTDADLILFIDQFGDWGYGGFGPFNTQSMWYHPEISIDSTNSFVPLANDIQGAVFGWHNKIGVRGTGVDSLRWMLNATNINWHQPVLWNMWKGTGYAWQHWNVNYLMINGTLIADTLHGGLNDPQSLLRDTSLYQPRNGKKWYVTVSIKATNTAQFNALADTARILSISIPYTLYHRFVNTTTTDSIRFDSIPNSTPNALYGIATPRNVNDVRGIARRNIQDINKPREFVITKRMLDGQETNQGITLSAFFMVDGRLDNLGAYIDNPILQPESNWTGDTTTVPDEYITNLGLNVYYYPNADVAIDYIRLETQQARRVYFGNQDVELRTTTQAIINDVAAAQTPPARQPKIFRFYQVEERRDQWWGMMRYYNALLNWRATAEVGSLHNQPVHYLHATGMNEFWQGDIFKTSVSTRFPAIRKAGTQALPTLGYYEGYEGNINDTYTQHDIESSRYEMQLPDYAPSWTALTFADFANNNTSWYTTNVAITERCLQFNLEKLLYNSFYKQSGLLYHSKPWWTNIWLSGQYWYRVNPNPNQVSSIALGYAGTIRPCTGEEARLELTLPLLLGSKGFMYWHNTPIQSSASNSYIQGLYSSEAEGWLDTLRTTFNNNPHNAVMSPQTASDWLNRTDNRFYPWQQWFNGTQHNWNLLGHDSNHVYLGDRTALYEVYRLNNYIRANEQEFLSLKLQAWYGKGYISIYSQTPTHSPANDTLLHRFINTGQIKSRPIGRVHVNTTPYYENEVSGRDSTFVDFVLHQRDNLSLDSVFYLGVQNRRTDPLWHDPNYANDQMIFVPTADWDDLMSIGNHAYWRAPLDNRTAAWWQDKYWKRQGCREIIIPFNYIPVDNEPRLLHVQEVGGGLDTIVKVNGKLAVNFTPGEGKLYRVTIQRSRNTVSNGDVENPNQRKMVSYPVTTLNTITHLLEYSNQIRYHITYHRLDTVTGRLNVYYRRSIPYPKEATILNGIQWNNELCLTQDSIAKLDGRNSLLTCGYPSLTVRLDSSIPAQPRIYVYVVYACADRPDTMKIRIVENIISAEGTQDPGVAREIDSTNGYRFENGQWLDDNSFLSAWGAPTINASAIGNYYSWADTLRGIVTRWKFPESRNFINGTPAISIRMSSSENSLCQHPNHTTFSRMFLGERECALVWEERLTPIAPNNFINYTVVHLNTNTSPFTISYKMPDGMTSITGFQCPIDTAANGDTTIAIISGNSTQWSGLHRYPMVYRGLEEFPNGNIPLRPYDNAHWDRVLWQSVPETGRSFITTCGIDYAYAFNGNPPLWSYWPRYTVTSLTSNLSHVQISQGGISQLDIDDFTNISGSSCLMNFQSRFAIGNDWHPQVWQINYGYWSFIPISPVLENWLLYPSNVNKITEGNTPRLSAQHSLTTKNQWNINRRLYHPSITNNTLVSSAEYFYKISPIDDYKPLNWAGYVLPSERRTMFAQPEIDGIVMNIQAKDDNGRQMIQAQFDTLKSNWFKVGNFSMLRSFVRGTNNPCLRMELQSRNNQSTRFVLPYTTGSGDNKQRNAIRLLRGGNEEYRVVVINSCGTNLRYTEEIQIDGVTPDDQLGKGVTEDEFVTIDIGKDIQKEHLLTIVPNPADNHVSIKFDGLPEDMDNPSHVYSMIITDVLGRVLHTGTIRAGETYQLNTERYTNASYQVRIRGNESSITMPFVIQR